MSAQPWDRKRPEDLEPIPHPVRAGELAAMDDEQLQQLLVDNLLPRGQAPAARAAWNALWTTLGQHATLQQRAMDLLDEAAERAEVTQQQPDLTGPMQKRLAKFLDQCSFAEDRLERIADRKPRPSRRERQLDAAIKQHRRRTLELDLAPSEADLDLWTNVANDPAND